MRFKIYRFDPEKDKKPYMQDYDLELENVECVYLSLVYNKYYSRCGLECIA
mgnify:CR=1 FL=1